MNDLLLDQAWDTTYQHGDLLPQIGQLHHPGASHYKCVLIVLIKLRGFLPFLN